MAKYKLEFNEQDGAGIDMLLMPFYSCVQYSKRGIAKDPKAEEIFDQIEYDFGELEMPRKTGMMQALRSACIDEWLSGYLIKNQPCMVINLGCGLDTRCERLDYAAHKWYDLDFPDVMELRSLFFRERGRYEMIGSSVTDYLWMDAAVRDAGTGAGDNTVIVAEGLMMYFDQSTVAEILSRMAGHFPGAYVVFDVCSRQAVEDMKRGGGPRKAGMRAIWGVDDPREIVKLCPGARHEQTLYITDSPLVGKLSLIERAELRLGGKEFKKSRYIEVLRLPGGGE